MIIKLTDGSTLDTDKMNDLSAQLMEAAAQYSDVMCRHKIPFVSLFVDPVTELVHPVCHVMSEDDRDRVMTAIDLFVARFGYKLTPITDSA